jgi:chemotaxis protein MotB
MSSRSSRRHRRGGGGAGDSGGHSGGSERWLVSYADLITLLFAFFVVLYSISQSDIKKFREVSEAMKRAFSAGSATPQSLKRGATPESFGASEAPGNPGIFMPTAAGQPSPADPEMDQIRRLLEEVAELDASVSKVELTSSGEIRWVILDSYPERGTRAAEDYLPLLRRVARVLARFPERRIRWEGHADPGEAGAMPSAEGSRALALASMERAEWMDQFMTQEWKSLGGAALRRSSAEIAGFAASRPLRLESSRWSQARNRRVELVILPRSGPIAEK